MSQEKIDHVLPSATFSDLLSQGWFLINLKAIFMSEPCSAAELYYLADKNMLQIIARPIGSEPLPQAREQLSTKDVHIMIRSGKVHVIQWINGDPMGLGTHWPLIPFHEISVKDSIFLRYVFKQNMPWVTGIFTTLQPIAPPDGG